MTDSYCLPPSDSNSSLSGHFADNQRNSIPLVDLTPTRPFELGIAEQQAEHVNEHPEQSASSNPVECRQLEKFGSLGEFEVLEQVLDFSPHNKHALFEFVTVRANRAQGLSTRTATYKGAVEATHR